MAEATTSSGDDTTCTCARVRRAARHLTQAYDRALAPSGLRLTQFSLLANADRVDGSLTQLAQRMGMDRTTLTRNLRPLQRDGLVRIGAGADGRQRRVALTRAGRAALARGRDLWRATQQDLERSLGAADVDRLHALLARAERWPAA